MSQNVVKIATQKVYGVLIAHYPLKRKHILSAKYATAQHLLSVREVFQIPVLIVCPSLTTRIRAFSDELGSVR